MRLLCFQAKRFHWKSFRKTLDDVAEQNIDDELRDCVVVFLHAESKDEASEARQRTFKHTLKHVKWLANKRDFQNIVLHSFTHLGADNATPTFAQEFLKDLQNRLTSTDYVVKCTPFGYFCEWDLEVHGESLAKVWKEI